MEDSDSEEWGAPQVFGKRPDGERSDDEMSDNEMPDDSRPFIDDWRFFDRLPMEIIIPNPNPVEHQEVSDLSEPEYSDLSDSEQEDSEQDSEQDEPQLPVDPPPPPLPPPRNYPPDQVSKIVQLYLDRPEIEQDDPDDFNFGIQSLKNIIYSHFIHTCLQSILIEDKGHPSLYSKFSSVQPIPDRIKNFLTNQYSEEILKKLDSLINYNYFMLILMNEWSLYLKQAETQYTETCNFDNVFESKYNELRKSLRGIEHYYFFMNSKTNEVFSYTRDEIEEKVKDFMNWHFYCKIEYHNPPTTWNTTIYDISPIFIKIKIHPDYDSLISLRNIFSILKYRTRLFYVDIRDSSDSHYLTATYENLTNTNTNIYICTREKITNILKKCINKPQDQNKKQKLFKDKRIIE
jgi:hypothetical protein